MTLLPLTYLGNLQWWKEVAGGDCIIDLHENYVKQSLRNRCEILSADGRRSLAVQVAGCKGVKTPVRDIRIDYSKRWQHRHWLSIVSSYGKAPYFEHYEGIFGPILLHRYEFLADLDLALAQAACRVLSPGKSLRVSDRYVVPAETDRDLRPKFMPRQAQLYNPTAPYYQVFSDRLPFEPNLSVIDLIFCEGPQARSILAGSD